MGHLFLHTLIYLLGTVIGIGTALYGWGRRDTPGGVYFVGLMLANVVWTGSAAVESLVVGEPAKVFWSQAEYVGLVFISVLLLFFVLAYMQQGAMLTRAARLFLWALPVVSLVAVWTNRWHGLVWTGFSPGDAALNILVYHRGPIFWFIIGYTYLLTAVSYGFLAWACKSADARFRRQYVALMMSGAFPLTTGAIYLLGQKWVLGLDVSPLGFCLEGMVMAWALFRFRLLDLVPVGRAVLVESMPDGMFVLDDKNRLVDMNPAARRMLGTDLVSRGVEQIVGRHPALASLLESREDRRIDLTVEVGVSLFDVRVVPLPDPRGRWRGRLFLLRDVTDAVKTARERERMIGELSKALARIRTLQGLVPICCSCKRIRNDQGYWQQIESYIRDHADVEFSHGLCPECEEKLYPDDGTVA